MFIYETVDMNVHGKNLRGHHTASLMEDENGLYIFETYEVWDEHMLAAYWTKEYDNHMDVALFDEEQHGLISALMEVIA